MKTQVEQNFSDYYEKWMAQLEDYVRLILMSPREQINCEELVNKLTTMHKEYYTFKWEEAHDDVLAFFTQVWFTPLEKAYLWITGWKPSIAFRLVDSLRSGGRYATLAGMSEEQVKKIEALRVKIKAEEERVEREMERQQVAMADRRIVELAILDGLAKQKGDAAAVSQVDGLVEVAVKGMLRGLERVMKMGDCVRLNTLKGVLDVLSPMQCVDFLAAMSVFQIQMRKWGRNYTF